MRPSFFAGPFESGHVPEPSEAVDQPASVADLPPERQALLVEAAGFAQVAQEHRRLLQLGEEAGNQSFVSELVPDLEAFLVGPSRGSVVAGELCAIPDLQHGPRHVFAVPELSTEG